MHNLLSLIFMHVYSLNIIKCSLQKNCDINLWLAFFIRIYTNRLSYMGQLNTGKWPACFARTAIWAFQNQKSGWSTRSFFWFGKRSTTNAKFARARSQKQLQTALILFCHFHLISSVSRPQPPLIFVSVAMILQSDSMALRSISDEMSPSQQASRGLVSRRFY